MNATNLLTKISDHIYLYVYSFVVIFTPLVFVADTNELFEFPKAFVIYFTALFAALIFTLDLLFNNRRVTKPSLPVLLYLVSFLISTIFSSHLYTSVWGYFSRFSDSLTSVVALVALYFVGKNTLTRNDVVRLTNVTLLPVFFIALLGISQHFGFFSGAYWFGEKVDRVYSSFGQPNWLAQYLVMLLPIILYRFLMAKESLRSVKAYYCYILFAAAFLCLLFTYSLSGFIGFAISFAFFVYMAITKMGFSTVKIRLGLIVIYIAICPLAFPGIFAKRLHDLKQDIFGFVRQPVFAQNIQIPQDPDKYAVSDAGYIRKYAWLGTWDLINSSPKVFIFGTGPETFPYAFQPFRPVELNYSSEWSYLFNKPHNYYLETWAETGLIGLVAYTVLVIYTIRKTVWEKKIGLVGFAVTNVFGWPVVATSFIFWLWILETEVNSND